MVCAHQYIANAYNTLVRRRYGKRLRPLLDAEIELGAEYQRDGLDAQLGVERLASYFLTHVAVEPSREEGKVADDTGIYEPAGVQMCECKGVGKQRDLVLSIQLQAAEVVGEDPSEAAATVARDTHLASCRVSEARSVVI